MDSSFSGLRHDPPGYEKMSITEKRELVYEISKCSHGGPEMLQSWSRRDLLEILCAELGKERKYTGLTKYKMIEHLLKIVSEKKAERLTRGSETLKNQSPIKSQNFNKRQRKADNPSRLTVGVDISLKSDGVDIPLKKTLEEENKNNVFCQNLACKACIRAEDLFCKRCSCCICHKYDDNKDPSLWLICSSEPPDREDSCGNSCHLECALKTEKAGIKSGCHAKLDGSFRCVSCGKVNDLLGSWRKQMMIAKTSRRVDVLCYRLSLSHKLLNGSEKYAKIHQLVDKSLKELEAEIGPIDGLPVKMARGIVNRLSCGANVQKHCSLAVELLDSLLMDSFIEKDSSAEEVITLEDVGPTSLTVVVGKNNATIEEHLCYKIWHRKADILSYPTDPAYTFSGSSEKFTVCDLCPKTDYCFRVISFDDGREIGKWEVCFRTSGSIEDSTEKRSFKEGNSSKSTCYSLDINCNGKIDHSPKGNNSNCTVQVACSEETPEMKGLDENGNGIPGESEPISAIQTDSQRDSTHSSSNDQGDEAPKSEKKHQFGSQLPKISIGSRSKGTTIIEMEAKQVDSSSRIPLSLTPCKHDKSIGGLPDKNFSNPDEPQAGSSSKKRNLGTPDEVMCSKDGSLERDYEYCVKVIRRLECEGHIQKTFREKFLTWLSLRATPQERKIVSVFIDTLLDDPPSLAGQLVDTFSEGICSKRVASASTGFCTKLWHH